MDKIVVTGVAGFISSCLVETLNRAGFEKNVIVDDFSYPQKQNNWKEKHYCDKVERNVFFDWFKKNHQDVRCVFHLGARTDTTEFNYAVFEELNVSYSKMIWQHCAEFGIPLIYASSAATYGSGALGYDDRHDIVTSLEPLNPYGKSKNEFDIWALQQKKMPPHWFGFKFFNVYGPNEYHKGRMASVVLHSFNQIIKSKSVSLFQSHRPDFANGMQLRDFIYVKDVADVLLWTMKHLPDNGLYNLGTGKARSFLALAQTVFNTLQIDENISFIPIPSDIRDKYQYFTEANMNKLRDAGYDKGFTSLEEGIQDYVENYLMPQHYY
jgi:ADP-L-glycero-D-manno-heptose 6-epimerase